VLLSGEPVHLRSDEALVALIALDIAGGSWAPLFLPGNNYGGGHAVEALLMAPLIRVFGSSELTAKCVPLLESLILLAIIFFLVRRLASAHAALISLALLSFWAPFVASNFMINGGMTTLTTGFLGLLLLLATNHRSHLRPAPLFATGILLGFSIYCFGYGVFFLVSAIASLIVLRHRTLLRELPGILAFGAGLVGGASPLLLGNGNVTAGLLIGDLIAAPSPADWAPGQRLLMFLTREIPSLFHETISDFPDRISVWSWATLLFTGFLSLLALMATARPGTGWQEAWRERRPWIPGRGQWTWMAAAALALFALLYNLHPLAGTAPRYLLPALPLILLPSACGITILARWRWAAGFIALALVLALQVPLLQRYYSNGNQVEWGVRIDGEDVRRVVQFLEERGYGTAVAPYELKYRISLLSGRRITVAAHVFGFDRKREDNAEAAQRLSAGAPLVMVLDREMRLPRIGQALNPAEAFYPDVFFPSLRDAGITWETVGFGDLVVLHHFSQPLRLPAVP
jgi:hypothetical protein